MIICPGCKKEILESQYCPFCGTRLADNGAQDNTKNASSRPSELSLTENDPDKAFQNNSKPAYNDPKLDAEQNTYNADTAQQSGLGYGYNQTHTQNTGFANQFSQFQQPQTISVGSYLLMMLIGMIPIAGLIVYLIWAFDSSTEPNKKNYSRANLIMILISFAICVLIYGLIFISVIGMLSAGVFSGR